jgi:hypothetical protein
MRAVAHSPLFCALLLSLVSHGLAQECSVGFGLLNHFMATATSKVMGNRGGNHASGSFPGSSGGGGATNVGGGATQYCGGSGGQGYTTNILHLTNAVYGSGGAGGSRGTSCSGPPGTNAGSASTGNGASAVANRGGGGGGGGTPCSGSRSGGSGGSGIVVVAYDTTNPMSITATGGSVATHGNWRSHQFTAVGAGSFSVLTAGHCDVLIVGGGGGGASSATCDAGGGGGGGQVIHMQRYGLVVSTYSITVGAGGAQNSPGSSSSFNAITAIGGGRGGGPSGDAGVGGSGGGAKRAGLGGLAATPPANLIPGMSLSYTSVSVGWTGVPQCLACEAGKYKSVTGALGCTDCPANTQSVAGSTEWRSCICNAGFGTTSDLINLARACSGGACTVTGISEYLDMPGIWAFSKLVDGQVGDGGAHTDTRLNAWMMIDLQQPAFVNHVRIFNRVDCCGSRLNNFQIRVGDSSTFSNNPACVTGEPSFNDVKDFSCVLSGRYVSIQQFHNESNMNLRELEVYGLKPAEVCPACAQGFYKAYAGAGACVACPANSQPATTSAATSCLCNAGTYSSSGTGTLPPVGIQQSYPISSISNLACTVCYDQAYSHATTSSNIEACKTSAGSSGWILMGSKTSSAATSFSLLAAIQGSNFVTSTSTTQAYLSNGVYWYYHNTKSVGFAESSNINIINADIVSVSQNCANRLSWHMDARGGYRSGCTLPLDTNSVWRKIMYHCNNAETCAACPVGTFKEAVGNASAAGAGCALLSGCCACGANETTLFAGSVHSDACVCLPGFAGLGCAPCAVGFYKAATSDAACEACPPGATTVFERSVALADCVAAPGFFGDSSSSSFQPCAAGSYKPTTGSGSCTPCPAGSTSPAASTSEQACACSLPGWRASVSPESGFCACQPGFARNGSGWCQPCAANFFCTGGDAPPAACPPDAASPPGSGAVAACACNAGYAGNGQACAACAAGTYENMTSHACVACPANSSSPAASASAAACACNAGYTGPNGQACTACAVGTYKATQGADACQACATFETTASTASVSAAACVCQAGAGLSSGACAACPAGTFKAHLSDEACDACPAFSASPPGSDAAADCQCNAGFSEPLSGPAVTARVMGTTVRVMGNNGGIDYGGPGGGGGGATVAPSSGGQGGQGYTTSITGTNEVFGSGGAAGSRDRVIIIGGTGAGNSGSPGTSGVPNRGGGGGAENEPAPRTNAGSGGSGIVVVGYDTTDPLSLQGTGGDSVVTTGNYRSHQFTNVGINTFTVHKAGRCDVLIVAGGGGGRTIYGDNFPGGGGGGGQVIHLQNYGLDVLTYNIVVGIGGQANSNGNASSFASITAIGGGSDHRDGGSGAGKSSRKGRIGLAVTPPANLVPGITLSYVSTSVGWSGTAQCDACVAGQYKDSTGAANCTACPANSQSPSASSLQTACACNAGYTGPNGGPCTACPAGAYKENNGSAACTACPANSGHALTAQTLAAACRCHRGFSGADGGACAACVASQYKTSNGSDACSACPANSGHALSAQTTITSCLCDAGYTGASGACTACPASTYKPAPGAAGCTPCPANSGHTLAAQAVAAACLCNPGYTGSDGGTCAACQVSTYKTDPGSAACAACPANSTSLPSSTNATACLCNAGFGGPPGGPCALCAAGTYELNRVCLACPANSDSVPGALGATACLCRAGYFGPPGGPCRLCAHGSFSAANSSACAACGPNANTSVIASTSAAACLCVPGYTSVNGNCQVCPANTFQPALGNASCTACTAHSTSPPGSTSPDACACSANFLKRAGNGTCARVCAAGFEAGGASLTECVGCRPGAYKTLEGDHACTPCPPNAFSLLANQTSISSCVCQHGYIFNATTLRCDACPPGTFNNQAGESQCFACVTVC